MSDWLAGVLVRVVVKLGRAAGLRLRVERHRLPNGHELPSFEVRDRRTGERVVVHIEPGL